MTTFATTLRALAEFIDTTDYDTKGRWGGGISINVDEGGVSFHMPYLEAAEEKAAVRKLMRAIGGSWEKTFSGTSMWFTQEGVGKFGGGNVTVFAKRDAVCERKVVGTKTVKHEARKAFTETVEVVEWECGSLLSDTPKLDAELANLLDAEAAVA